MDSGLKQRLLGAAVLIALAIIFVPMFLGNSPPRETSAIQNLDIPPLPATVKTATNEFKVGKYPTSPRTGGYEYVWHCHILEHEEHDMMRPLVVQP